MKRVKGSQLFLLVFIGVSVLSISLATFFKDESQDNRSNASETIDVPLKKIEGLPQVVSLPPTTAKVGENFRYYLRIVDSDSDPSAISVSVVTAPEWLLFNPEKNLLYGVAEIGNSNTQKVTLLVTDGENTIEETFYLLITENE